MGQSAVRALVAPPRLFSSLRQKRYKSFPSVFHVLQKIFSTNKKIDFINQKAFKTFSKLLFLRVLFTINY